MNLYLNYLLLAYFWYQFVWIMIIVRVARDLIHHSLLIRWRKDEEGGQRNRRCRCSPWRRNRRPVHRIRPSSVPTIRPNAGKSRARMSSPSPQAVKKLQRWTIIQRSTKILRNWTWRRRRWSLKNVWIWIVKSTTCCIRCATAWMCRICWAISSIRRPAWPRRWRTR